MKATDKEKVEVQNLLKIIRRASFKEMDGLEALALARAYHWLSSLLIPEPPVPAPATQVMPEEAKISIQEPEKTKKKKSK